MAKKSLYSACPAKEVVQEAMSSEVRSVKMKLVKF
jgi:hypothetical protein